MKKSEMQEKFRRQLERRQEDMIRELLQMEQMKRHLH